MVCICGFLQNTAPTETIYSSLTIRTHQLPIHVIWQALQYYLYNATVSKGLASNCLKTLVTQHCHVIDTWRIAYLLLRSTYSCVPANLRNPTIRIIASTPPPPPGATLYALVQELTGIQPLCKLYFDSLAGELITMWLCQINYYMTLVRNGASHSPILLLAYTCREDPFTITVLIFLLTELTLPLMSTFINCCNLSLGRLFHKITKIWESVSTIMLALHI